jgi:hypothetical protein
MQRRNSDRSNTLCRKIIAHTLLQTLHAVDNCQSERVGERVLSGNRNISPHSITSFTIMSMHAHVSA